MLGYPQMQTALKLLRPTSGNWGASRSVERRLLKRHGLDVSVIGLERSDISICKRAGSV